LLFFYHIFLGLYAVGIRFTSIWNKKARMWINGRKGLLEKLEMSIGKNPGKIIWFHCASLGEFEQGRTLIEAIRSQYPGYKILLSFFSPSGYEIQKNYQGAEWVIYLPLDGKKIAKRFLEVINPSLIVFIKYDLWYYYLSLAKENGIPALLVSAVFRKQQSFFTWYGRLQRKMLNFFNHIFVQNDLSASLLNNIGMQNVTVAGDTRFDRVAEISKNSKPIPAIEDFISRHNCIVAGSTWKDDEEMLQKWFASDPEKKLIIAPHEITETRIEFLEKLFPGSIRFSKLETSGKETKVLIIDNIGMLSRLYSYGDITYVGGGFTRDGVHNVLEAAVWGKPVIMGPNYKKYSEAIQLVASGGGKSFASVQELKKINEDLFSNNMAYNAACLSSKKFVLENTGATGVVMNYIAENRLLTN
jgi:3-deoxy-D-manno-octulosonic-acid transferase